MSTLVVLTPLIAALIGLGLNRLVATRWITFGVAAALAISGAILLALRATAPMVVLADMPWIAVGSEVRLTLKLGENDWAVALAALIGAAGGLAGLGLALPEDVRGFAGVPAALGLTAVAVLIGIANRTMIVQPALWILVALLMSITLRASEAVAGSDAPLIVALCGGAIFLALLAAELLVDGGSLPQAALICVTLACLLAIGAAPFNAVAGAISEGPGGLGGTLLAVGLPLLGGHTLIRSASVGGPPGWYLALTLLGIFTLLACGAGALGERRARRLVAWQHGAQQGFLLVAVGQGAPALAAIAPALLLSASATTLVAGLVVALFERYTGSDDLTTAELRAPLLLPGLAWLVAGASAVGAPGTWGFWGHFWLMDGLVSSERLWAAGPLLVGSALLVLSYLMPLGSLWRGAPDAREEQGARWPGWMQMLPTLAAIPIGLLGLFPMILSGAPSISPLTSGVMLLSTLLLVGLPTLIYRRIDRQPSPDRDDLAVGALRPAAIGESLEGLAWLAAPGAVMNLAWESLLWVSLLLTRLLARFEQRYYLAGLTIAMIITVLIFL